MTTLQKNPLIMPKEQESLCACLHELTVVIATIGNFGCQEIKL